MIAINIWAASCAVSSYWCDQCNRSACNLLLPWLRCVSGQSVISPWPCGLREQRLKSKWLTCSQLSQALQSCNDLILCLSAPSAPLIDPEWGGAAEGSWLPLLDTFSRVISCKYCVQCKDNVCLHAFYQNHARPDVNWPFDTILWSYIDCSDDAAFYH